MVNTELRILRVFGPTAAEVSAVLRQARADGCPGLRLLEQGGLQKQVAAGITGNAQLRQDQQLDTASSGFFHAA